MRPSPQFIDNLLSSDIGRIVACNLLSGLSIDLYNVNFLVPAMVWWESLVNFRNYKNGDEIVGAIVTLPELAHGRYPTGFIPPAVPLGDPYIAARRTRTFNPRAWVASAREAHTLIKCGHPEDLKRLERAGIVLTAKPGTRTYKRSLENSWKGLASKLRVVFGPSKSLTNPRDNFAMLWFTPAAVLHNKLKSTDISKKADAARDLLSLVHYNQRNTLAIIFIRAAFAERRPDRGRPTFLDARHHSRFKCLRTDEASRPPWGSTPDLSQLAAAVTGDVTGHEERVCGRVPAQPNPPGQEPVLEVRFLGAPSVPRKDFVGVGDKEFANLLENDTAAAAGGIGVRDQLLALCVL
jgi:hypothetical protein